MYSSLIHGLFNLKKESEMSNRFKSPRVYGASQIVLPRFALMFILLLYVSLQGANRISGQGALPNVFQYDNFFQLQKDMNDYYLNHPNTKDELHWRRYESFYEPRVYPHGDVDKFTNTLNNEIIAFKKKEKGNLKSAHGDWNFLGPSSLTPANFGRCVRMTFHPTNPNIIFVLTSSAGLWQSSDNGSTWSNLTEDLPYLFGIDFQVSHSDPDDIFILTSNVKNGLYGLGSTQGIYYTTDGGQTWEVSNPFAGSPSGARMVMHPTSSNIMYAGMSDGIYRTTDAWQTATIVSTDPGIYDIEFKPGDPSVMYACSNSKFLKSTNYGLIGSWNQIIDPVLGFLTSMNRAEIGVTSGRTDCVYLVASNTTSDYIVRSLGSGDAGTWTTRAFSLDLWWGQPGYNMGIAVNPSNYNHIYVMAIALWQSTNGGVSVHDVYGTHVDHHELIFRGSEIYDLNDGGVGKSVNYGSSWTHMTPGIEVFEGYSISGTPLNTSLLYTGAQDVGGSRIDPGGNFQPVCSCCTGDVVESMVDYSDENKAYMVAQGGGLRFTSDGWVTCNDTGPGDANFELEFGDGRFLCPYEMDVVEPKFIYTGKDSMWRLDMAAQSSQYLGYPGPGKTARITQGRDNRNRMYIIQGASMYRTDEALTTSPSGATWTMISNDFIVAAATKDIAVNPKNADEMYVVYSGTAAGKKVYFSNNKGSFGSWQNISSGLPNVPINCIEMHNNILNNHAMYVGTDMGVFYKDDSLTDWVYFGNNLPAAPVTDIYINPTSSKVIVSTLGRGIWHSNVYLPCSSSLVLLANNQETGGKLRYARSNTILSFKEYDTSFSTDVIYQAGQYIDLLPGFSASGPGNFVAQIGDCPIIEE